MALSYRLSSEFHFPSYISIIAWKQDQSDLYLLALYPKIEHMEQQGEIILYQPDESVRMEVRIEDETVWLTQAQIAELFETKRQAITKHLKNIFQSGELNENSVCSILELTASDGKSYKTKHTIWTLSFL